MAVVGQVKPLLEAHPAVKSVQLVGSRQQGTAVELSDWDFEVATDDFATVSDELPTLVEPLHPLAQQWDRLGEYPTYLLMLPDAVKVDLLFPDQPFEEQPPWDARPDTLQAIDDHFWDWLLWIAAKDSAGKAGVVRAELAKMHTHLLGPLGAKNTPGTIEEAVELYLAARRDAETRFGTNVSTAVEEAVRAALRKAGYSC